MGNNRFLVIGGGSIGKRHIRNLLSLEERDICVYDPRADRRDEITTEFTIETFDNLEKAWEKGPSVALITTPTAFHVSLALQAAEHGCHLFIEKPISDEHSDALERLLRIVKDKNLTTLVGCNMRFHPGLIKVKALLAEKAIGRMSSAHVEFGQYLPDWHPWEDYRTGYSARRDLGGGIILDAIHEIDYVRWLMGEIDSVACFSSHVSHLDIDTEDTASILVRFASGSVGEIHLDYIQRSPRRACTIIGDEGTIHWDNEAGEVRCYLASSRTWESFKNPPHFDVNQIYVDEMRHFLSCVSGAEQPVLDVFEASRVLQVALAAKESAKTHQFMAVHS